MNSNKDQNSTSDTLSNLEYYLIYIVFKNQFLLKSLILMKIDFWILYYINLMFFRIL